MGRYHFREDEDDDDTDYDSPSKDHWDRSHYQRSHRADAHADDDSNTAEREREEGEIFEAVSSDNDMDESDDNFNDNDCRDRDTSTNTIHQDGWNPEPEEEESEEDLKTARRSFRSYFPSFSDKKKRIRKDNNNTSRSPSPDPSFRGGRSRECDGSGGDGDREIHEPREDHHDRLDGNKEYQLIASSKYDRNYDRDDFYPTDIHRKNSHESNNSNSNSYTNPVSDDDEHDTPYDRNRNQDYGYISDRYQSEGDNGAMMRRSSQHNASNGAPEVHYHIYVSEKQASRWFPPSETEVPPRLSDGKNLEGKNDKFSKSKTALWKKISLWAVLTQLLVFLVRRYDLIALSPPPSYLTWEEYRNHQLRLVRKVSRETSSLLKHLIMGALSGSNNNKDEDNFVMSPRYSFPESWTSFVPQRSSGGRPTENSSNHSRETIIFGQKVALEHLRSGLNLWSSSRRMIHHRAKRLQQPLVVYASGGTGVGKGSLAYLLLGQLESFDVSTRDATASVLQECAAAKDVSVEAMPDEDVSEVAPNRGHYCPLLHLTPSDYHPRSRPRDYQGDDDDDAYHAENYDGFTMEMVESGGRVDGDTSLSPLYQRLLDHVVAAGGGASIVVLENVDASNIALPSLWLKNLMAEVQSQNAIFGNTIFVLTSQIGRNTVEKWTRKRLQSLQGSGEEAVVAAAAAAANTEVEALLRYELRRHYVVTSGSEEDDAQDTSMGIDDWLLVPMAPLDKNSMARILENNANSGPNPPLLDDRESIGIHHEDPMTAASSPKRSLTLTEAASDRILDALEWHQWMHKTSGEVLRIWSPNGARPLLDLWKDRVLEPIASLPECRWIHGESRDASTTTMTMPVLDLEGSSTDRLWLRSCELAEGHGTTVSTDGRRWKCSGGSCVFYL